MSLAVRAGLALPKPHLSELDLQSSSESKPGAGLSSMSRGRAGQSLSKALDRGPALILAGFSRVNFLSGGRRPW